MKTRTNRLLMTLALPALLGAAAGCGAGGDEIEAETAALTNGQLIYDWSTQCTATTPDGRTSQQMHCCPTGFAMNGIYNSGSGVFKCFGFARADDAKILATSSQVTVAPLGRTTPTTTMRGCPAGTVMIGYHGTKNYLACQAYLPSRGAHYSAFRDDSTQDQDRSLWKPVPPPQMHVCLYRDNLMVGIQPAANQFACLEESFAP